MAGRVGDPIGAADHAVGIDQVADPERVGLALVARRTFGVVRLADGAFGVAQQWEREVELLREGPVAIGRVERRTEDPAVGTLEVVGLITQTLSLERSTRRVGLRIPPQQYPAAAQVLQFDHVAAVVGQREVGGGVVDGQHDRTVPQTSGGP